MLNDLEEADFNKLDNDQKCALLKELADLLIYEYPERARRLYELAASLGDADAMFEAARLYEDDDIERADALYRKAVEHGHPDAVESFARMWAERDPKRVGSLVDFVLSYEDNNQGDIAERYATHLEAIDHDSAIRLYRHAIQQGCPLAPHLLAELLLRRDKRNRDEALKLLRLASERGNVCSTKKLAEMLEDDNPSEAADLYERAFEGHGGWSGVDEAAAPLAKLVKESDTERALKPFDTIMKCLSAKAKNDYANQIESIDPEKAAQLYEDARILLVEDKGFYYTRITPKNADIPTSIFVSDLGAGRNDRYNPPRVLVSNYKEKRDDGRRDGFAVSISKEPRVLRGENRLSPEDWEKTKAFIIANYDVLMNHWITAEDQDSSDLFMMLFPEKYRSIMPWEEKMKQAFLDAEKVFYFDSVKDKLVSLDRSNDSTGRKCKPPLTNDGGPWLDTIDFEIDVQ